MPMNRAQKEAEVAEIRQQLESSELVVVTQNTGLNSKATADMRVSLRKEGVQCKVSKNTLARMALKGTRFEGLSDMLAGPTMMATSKDTVAAARAAYEFAKGNDKLVIIGGALGEMILDKEAVERLAKLPSLDVLRSKLLGLLMAGPTKLAGILQAPARDLVGVTKAYGEKSA